MFVSRLGRRLKAKTTGRVSVLWLNWHSQPTMSRGSYKEGLSGREPRCTVVLAIVLSLEYVYTNKQIVDLILHPTVARVVED